jgi:hypothetical protein
MRSKTFKTTGCLGSVHALINGKCDMSYIPDIFDSQLFSVSYSWFNTLAARLIYSKWSGTENSKQDHCSDVQAGVVEIEADPDAARGVD